jgi:hypothetical protein
MKCATYIVVNEVMCEHFNILCSILPGWFHWFVLFKLKFKFIVHYT